MTVEKTEMQNYEYEHNSFILYKDSRIFINRLSKCQRGELLLAIFDYVCDGIIPNFEDDAMLQMCFDIIRSYLDRDEKKYRDKCEKNRKIAIEREANKRKKQNIERANSYTNKHEVQIRIRITPIRIQIRIRILSVILILTVIRILKQIQDRMTLFLLTVSRHRLRR